MRGTPRLSAPYVVDTPPAGRSCKARSGTAASGRFEGIGCHQFFASKDTDTASFALENNNDEAHGGHIVEQSSSGTWLEIIGSATGPFSVSGDLITSIDASGTGSVWVLARLHRPIRFRAGTSSRAARRTCG